MQLIEPLNILYMIIPLSIVTYFYYKYIGNSYEIIYASLRMIIQLVAIGYLLVYLFSNDSIYVGLLVVLFMITMSSFIAMRHIENKTLKSFIIIFTAIGIGGSFVLVLILEFVLNLKPLYQPRYVIALSGMIYANCMNAVSLVAERFERELLSDSYEQARKIALKASLIPKINMFLAVGLVALPGMMTGQILSGTDPIIAVRYQIVVMAMMMGSAGISVIIYMLLTNHFISKTKCNYK